MMSRICVIHHTFFEERRKTRAGMYRDPVAASGKQLAAEFLRARHGIQRRREIHFIQKRGTHLLMFGQQIEIVIVYRRRVLTRRGLFTGQDQRVRGAGQRFRQTCGRNDQIRVAKAVFLMTEPQRSALFIEQVFRLLNA